MKPIIFSGIQPSGQLHIGNYFGAIKSWLELQADPKNDCIFAIVDYHALTESPDPRELEQRIFETAVDFLAAGLEPNKSTIILQSLVPEHTDLQWILNCVTPVAWLERVPTYKDKAQQFKDNINMGLLDYPVLMAADILIYKATVVPVGQDQFAHLELAREIARAFNSHYGKTLAEPQAKITPTPKIMSLNDPTKKMSKSLGAQSYIALADAPETIRKKIKSAVTAVGNEEKVMHELLIHTKEITDEFDGKAAPDSHGGSVNSIRSEKDISELKRKLGDHMFAKFMAYFNFYMLLCIFAEHNDRQRFVSDLRNKNVKFSFYKDLLTDKIINNPELSAFRKKREQLMKNPKKIETILKNGSARARRRAQKTLLEVKKKIGLA